MQSVSITGVGKAASRVGLGCIRMSLAREAESFALMDAYFECGGNLLDTAEVYGRGESERAVGSYLRRQGRRTDALLVTKGAVAPELVRPEYIRGAIERSLERLQTDHVDLYLLHRDDPSVPVSELVDVLEEAANQGRIRSFGGSNWSVARLDEANRYAAARGARSFVVSSPHLALAIPREPWWAGCTHATPGDLAWYAEKGMPVLAWSTQGRGFLGGRPIEDEAHAAHIARVYGSDDNLERRRRLHQLARELGIDPAQLAVAYVLSLDAPTVALVGPLTADEVPRLMAAAEIRLSQAQRSWLELAQP